MPKITGFTALTTPAVSDLLAIVDDPAGVPVTKKITLANLFSDYNVKWYGAIGDDATDDTAAIQAAINAAEAAGGGIVYFPPGVYRVTGLAVTSNIRLLGAGRAFSRIRQITAAACIVLDGSVGTPVRKITIEKLWVDGDDTGTIGIDMNYARQCQIHQCRIEEFATAGIDANNSWTNRVSFSHITDCNTGPAINLDDESNDFNIYGCVLNANDRGVYLTNAGPQHGVAIRDCLIQAHNKDGVLINGGGTGSRAIEISGCYFEGNNVNAGSFSDINADLVYGLAITGCKFASENSDAHIDLDDADNVFVAGCSSPTSGSLPYDIVTTTSTGSVFVAGCSFPQGYNDVGHCIRESDDVFTVRGRTQPPLLVEYEDAGTATIRNAAIFRRKTSGTAANNIGVDVKFSVENDAGTMEDTGKIESVLTNAADGSEAADLRFFTRAAGGALTEGARLTGAGVLQALRDLLVNSSGTSISLIRHGTAVLVAGTVAVSDANVTASSRILLTSQADGGTPGWLRVSGRVVGTSFTITSSNGSDTSTVGWLMVEP